jgi:H+-transporting ATPase
MVALHELTFNRTGTLTQNKLSLAEPYTIGDYQPDELMLAACLAASRKEKGLDAIDKAFLKALRRYPLTKDMIPTFKILEFIPFDPVSKKTTVVVRSQRGERITCVKGAPATIMKLVSEVDGHIPEGTALEYNDKVAEFAGRGFRSLGVARKRAGSQWELLGIMPCSDPPRHDTAKTMAEAIDLGLKVKMLTGDAVGIGSEPFPYSPFDKSCPKLPSAKGSSMLNLCFI